jgi:pSer/pThr/pTyr-binding forkhead associated (FHA) protein
MNLTVLYPPDAAQTIALTASGPFANAPFLIGRGPACALRLAEEAVSREHCEIIEKDGQFFVRDLGSANGTFLDGVAVGMEPPLRVGAHLQIGSAVLALQEAPSIRLHNPAPSPEQFVQEETEFWGAGKNVKLSLNDELLQSN